MIIFSVQFSFFLNFSIDFLRTMSNQLIYYKDPFGILLFNSITTYLTLFNHSHKKRIVWKHGLVELAVLRTYVENQAILEPILLYRRSKCKQTKEQGSEDCL